MKTTYLAMAGLITLSSSFVWADARGMAMGGVGVASANNLEAPFYNPALASTKHQGVGLLLPSFTAAVHDGDELYNKVDELAAATERLNRDLNDAALQNEWKSALGELNQVQSVADVNLGIVVAIPTDLVSFNFFTKAETVFIATTHIDSNDLNLKFNDPACSVSVENCMDSTVQGLAGLVGDVGVAIATDFYVPIGGQDMRIAVGVAPKFQSLTALNYEVKAAGFDEDLLEFGDDDVDTSGMNMDVGVAIYPTDNVTVGLAAMNLFKHQLETNFQQGRRDTFIVEAQYTAGASYHDGLFTAALDIDLNERRYFESLGYSTQFARVGVEFDAWRWAQVRLGYQHSMNSYSDDVVSAGVGLKPFGRMGVDLMAQYGGDNRYGFGAQLYFGF